MSVKSIKNIKVAGNPADVATLWKTYMNGGLTSQFLTGLLRLKEENTDARGRPSKDFQAFVNRGLQQLAEEKDIKDVSEKVLLGCLTAIKGVHFKSQASYAVEDLILASADMVTGNLCNLTEQQRVVVSRALNALISVQQPSASLEELFQQDILQLEHDRTSPFPFVKDNDLSNGSNGKSNNGLNHRRPSFAGPSSQTAFKFVSILTFKCCETFPFLMKLPIEEAIWKTYIEQLQAAGHRFCIAAAIKFYPDLCTLEDLKWLENAFLAFEDWEEFANLLGFVHHVRLNVQEKIKFKVEKASAKVLQPQDTTPGENHHLEGSHEHHKRNVEGLSHAKGYFQSNLALKVSDAFIARDGRPLSEMMIHPSINGAVTLMSLSDADFLAVMETFLNVCLEAESTLSLRGAGLIVRDFGALCSLSEEQLKSKTMVKKFTAFVVKDRWMIGAQMAHNMETKVCLYNLLVEYEKYSEAKEYCALYNLSAHVTPVAEQLIEAQEKKLKDTYLQLPTQATKIVMVDSVQTVQYMASVLGFTLQRRQPATTGNVANTIAAGSEKLDINDNTSDEANEKFQCTNLRMKDIVQAIAQKRFNIQPNAAMTASFGSAAMDVVGTTSPHATTEITAEATVFSSILPKLSSPSKKGTATPTVFRNVIGLDAEWKIEVYNDSSDCGAGIFQVATPDHVFLLDLYTIGNVHDTTFDNAEVLGLSIDLIRQLFSDKTLLKIAFDFYLEDLKMIRKAGRGAFMNSIQTIESLLDIQYEVRDWENFMRFEPRTEGVGVKDVASLSATCQRYLGKPLLKTRQLSDWKQRPLNTAQMLYASLDAHSLVGVLDALLLEKNIDSGINVALQQYQIHDILEQNRMKVQEILQASLNQKSPKKGSKFSTNKKSKFEA